jgi:hypothetical protein
MQAGLGEHDEARVVEYIEGLQRCNAVVAGLAKTARALAKTQRTQARYLCLVLEGYVEPPVGFADGAEPIKVTPVAADDLPPGPINGAATQQPQNVPPPVEPSGAPDEFPFQGGA